jgi:hypothetical protein
MILHGGHDGNKHMHDTHIFNFKNRTWTEVETINDPDPRDSHVAVVHGNGMYILGGSTGGAVGDFKRLDLSTFMWSGVKDTTPRFCHTGVMFEDSLYCFGGYDGSERLNDFMQFKFYAAPKVDKCSDSLISDLKKHVNNELLSDITFIVEGRRIHGHKLLCLRCPYFYGMLTGEYMESRAAELVVEDVRYEVFLLFLEFVYSDSAPITLDVAMDLFQAADRFGMERLKKQCEDVMNDAISIETAAHILLAADMHRADVLRERCMRFIQLHFETVSCTAGFEEMSRASLDLNLEIIRRRFAAAKV